MSARVFVTLEEFAISLRKFGDRHGRSFTDDEVNEWFHERNAGLINDASSAGDLEHVIRQVRSSSFTTSPQLPN